MSAQVFVVLLSRKALAGSFTDFIVPWGLYITLQRMEMRRRRGSLPRNETEPLLPSSHAAPAVHSLQSLDVSEHWAIPQRWGCSPSSKLYSSAVLVTVLGAASAVATYYTIVQSVDMDWDCAAVHSR